MIQINVPIYTIQDYEDLKEAIYQIEGAHKLLGDSESKIPIALEVLNEVLSVVEEDL